MKKMSKEDLYFFNQGKLYDAYRIVGAHLEDDNSRNLKGTRFTVWAPHAKEVNVLGEFNDYQPWVHNLIKVDKTGVWSIFIETALEWAKYKYEIKTFDGRALYKSDPYAFFSSERPETLSKIYNMEGYTWHDSKYMKNRNKKNPYESQMSMYEVHLATWMTKPDGSIYLKMGLHMLN